MRTVYLIGLPGAGKTTIVRLALKLLDLQPVVEHITPIPHVRHGTLWHLGRHREPFGGTDTLSMSINPKAIAWVKELAAGPGVIRNVVTGEPCLAYDPGAPAVLLGEGDRLANRAFFDACPALTVVWLETPVKAAQERADRRAGAAGVPLQDATWWKGRVTKVANIVNSRPVVRLDGLSPPAESAAALAELLAAPAP
jgi:hypothetical protein